MKLFRTLIIAGGAYVLGAKAGRERYEQIMDLAQQLWNSRTIRNVGDNVHKIRDEIVVEDE
ncbi:hypothetical protein JTE88_00565 [Arcanobacterium phocisimile]|uniref:YtxH domain-containing protein n=1 Tax=Arcanobacterium phocisimile TaxID=1302235 RepID=A0ABX7IHG7_9ACTO|nr:hypothetical protein [Arcanobacterium phocisimile]QRV02290.1 hypothetical protein JTE88_00565 [Arcanobacterium phocisimile]